MSRIFLSHASADERAAVALCRWLRDNGWDDVFLDVDPRRGLVAGERWQEALRRAADRCEAVLVLLSPAWARSKWCVTEFLLARNLNKRVFGVVLRDVPLDELPVELTAEWQLCRLVGEGRTQAVCFEYREAEDRVEFLAAGLARLGDGLRRAGLDALSFAWPPVDDPRRAPYRGLEPLEAVDAAVFFGRDVEILRGLDALRGMRASLDRRLFVILGASGAGKSSFLRAGLLPRLARDEAHFLALAPVRPERAPLTGEHGLAQALRRAQVLLNLPAATPGELRRMLLGAPDAAPLAQLLQALRDAAAARLSQPAEGAVPPTLVLPVDQAEELFNADAGEEAHRFLGLIGGVLGAAGAAPDAVRMIVAFTIRSDRYEPLQAAPELAGLHSVVFDDLKPMPPTRFREVIEGPARQSTAAGTPLRLEPALVDRLVEESAAGGDTLPLLGLMLARLYRDYAGDGRLTLDDYLDMGGLASIVKTEVERVLAADPVQRQAQLEWLHAAFVPWLATINPANDQPMRRVARLADLPPESHALIRALDERRLLLMDQRGGETAVEVAHEALLRQWDVLAGWLATEREDLKQADALERAAQAWADNGRRDAWLLEGERLAGAEALVARRGFGQRLEGCGDFLVASRRREDARREQEEQRRQAELEAARRIAAEQSRRAELELQARQAAEAAARRLQAGQRRLRIASGVAVLVAAGAVMLFFRAQESERQALAASARANALRLGAQAQAMLANTGTRVRGESDERALLQLLAAERLAPGAVDGELLDTLQQRRALLKIVAVTGSMQHLALSPDGRRILTGGVLEFRLWDAATGHAWTEQLKDGGTLSTDSLAFSADGRHVAVGANNGELQLRDAGSGAMTASEPSAHRHNIHALAFSPDSRVLVSAGEEGTLRLWDTTDRLRPLRPHLRGHGAAVKGVAFSPDGQRIASGSDDGTLRLWAARSGRPLGAALQAHRGGVTAVAFLPDGERLLSAGRDGTLRLWPARSGQPLGEPLRGHAGPVTAMALSPDGRRIVSGGEDRTLRLWDAHTGQALGAPLRGHHTALAGVAFSPDGRRLISIGSDDAGLWFWDAGMAQPLGRVLAAQGQAIRALVFSPDGRRLASAGLRQGLQLWDAASGQAIGTPQATAGRLTSLAFSPDGRRIASGGLDHGVRLWDAGTGAPAAGPWTGHRGPVSGVAFVSDGRQIVSGSSDTQLRLWDAETGAPLGELLRGVTHEVDDLAGSPDGRQVVFTSGGYSLMHWDVARRESSHFAPNPGGPAAQSCVAISSDGSLVAAGTSNGPLYLWSTATRRLVGPPLQGHRDGVRDVAFSPDGQRIASAGADGTVRLWAATTGQSLGAPLEGHVGGVNTVAFSPDMRSLVSGGDDGTLRLWPGPKAWPELLCAKLSRNMSRRQWREWVSPAQPYLCQCPGLPLAPEDLMSKPGAACGVTAAAPARL